MIEFSRDRNEILIDGQPTGWMVRHMINRTCVLNRSGEILPMPHPRYSTAHVHPPSGAPGVLAFEADFRAAAGFGGTALDHHA